MNEIGSALREARTAASLSLAALSRAVHYSVSYLSLVESGKRPATSEVIESYERVLGVGGLGDAVKRREFLQVTALAAANAKLVAEVTASVAGNDPGPLSTVQTTYAVDRAVASFTDRGSVRLLRRWVTDNPGPVTRVNAVGILAKVPGQGEADLVAKVLGRDDDVRDLYMTAVVARVCSLDWSTAAQRARYPRGFTSPSLAADRFTREVINPADAGARWCSAVMLQRLSPMIGR